MLLAIFAKRLHLKLHKDSIKKTPSTPPSGLGNYFVCKRFAVQTLLWSLEFMVQINLEHDIIAVWNLARSWSISNQRFKYQKFRKTSQRWMYLTQQFQNFGFQWILFQIKFLFRYYFQLPMMLLLTLNNFTQGITNSFKAH